MPDDHDPQSGAAQELVEDLQTSCPYTSGPKRQVLECSNLPMEQPPETAFSAPMASSALAPIPANLSLAQAAAIPLTALTSWQALFDAGQLKAGQSVLIHGGDGGPGAGLWCGEFVQR